MNIDFKPTFLYIKTHSYTGLKYFGKTTLSDPYKYKGSGKKWLNHIRKHGYHVSTELLGYFTNKEECNIAAIKFSIENNIVESSDWANLSIENGTDGGIRSNSGENFKILNAMPKTTLQRNHISNLLSGRNQSEESIARRKITQAGQSKGIPKPLVICRLSDRKEMSATGFAAYSRFLK